MTLDELIPRVRKQDIPIDEVVSVLRDALATAKPPARNRLLQAQAMAKTIAKRKRGPEELWRQLLEYLEVGNWLNK
jgi:hypothetical protein